MALADFGLQGYTVKRQAASQRDAQLAQNAYSRFLSADRGTRSMEQLNRGMTGGLEKFGAGYGQRGLRNSGVFKQAQSDYTSEWMRQKQAIMDEVARANRQASIADATAWSNYNAVAGDAEMDKWNQILSTAAQLQSIMGG
jgi:cell division septum initiation protein DivIVA